MAFVRCGGVKRLRDPIHNYVLLEPWALALIDGPEFQRLRHVRQLGTVHLVYPGANHTRFEHGVGAYHLACRATEALGLGGDDARHVRAAVLLHDVGHGPFSHLSEEAVRRATGKGHVEIGCDLIQGPLERILAAHGLSAPRVAELVRGGGELGKLVSGELDVDRMDYLARDSHYTGVTVGVDLERLVSKIAWRRGQIVLDEEGLAAAESLLVTRFLMYTAVYFHHACRAAEMMLRRAIDHALEQRLFSGDELARFDDVELISRLRTAPPPAGEWYRRVEARQLYKLAHEASFREAGEARVRRHAESAGRRSLEAEIAGAAGLAADAALVDVPELPILPEVDVRVLGPSGVKPIAEASRLVGILHQAQMDHWRLRVYAPEEHREAVAKAAARITGTT